MIKGLLSFLSPVPSGTADNLQKAVIKGTRLVVNQGLGGTESPAINECLGSLIGSTDGKHLPWMSVHTLLCVGVLSRGGDPTQLHCRGGWAE